MEKQSQSLWQFLTQMNPSILNIRTAPISDEAASLLYKLWRQSEDNSGNAIISADQDKTLIRALDLQGYIRTIMGSKSAGTGSTLSVQFTDKGKQIIRNIILAGEKSAYARKLNEHEMIDYESIHRSIVQPKRVSTACKTAESHNVSTYAEIGWFKRCQ